MYPQTAVTGLPLILICLTVLILLFQSFFSSQDTWVHPGEDFTFWLPGQNVVHQLVWQGPVHDDYLAVLTVGFSQQGATPTPVALTQGVPISSLCCGEGLKSRSQ